MGLFSRKSRSSADSTTIFFASDIHGSEVCFRKFVNAAQFYKADVLLLGGDISGKLVVPVVEEGEGRWMASLHGSQERLDGSTIDAFERRAWDSGLYTKRMGPDEYQHYADHPEDVDALFAQVMESTLRRWIDYAKTRLEGSPVVILNAPGNDDPQLVDGIILEHGDDRFRFVEGQVVEIAPGHELLSTGYTNHTPWDTHREYTEEQISEHLQTMVEQLENPSTAIFNIHVPPYNSRIDTAPLLGQDLKVKTSAGAQMTQPVGSTAVRDAIESVQPLLSLHGHIHESWGSVKIGNSTVINVGSEYGEGLLRGILVTVGDGEIKGYQSVTG